MSLQIGKAIYHLLKKDSRIKEKVGSKIYPLIVEESTTFPISHQTTLKAVIPLMNLLRLM
mgnify:CR=1 FL=1